MYVRRRLVVGALSLVLALVAVTTISQLVSGSPPDDDETTADPLVNPLVNPIADSVPAADADAIPGDDVGDVVDDIEPAGCLLEETQVAAGDSGGSVECAQRALRAAGFYDGEITGTFDDATGAAARAFQTEVGLYVDGIVGKNTAIELGIWPGQEAFIVRTPVPPPGAVDLIGMPLSPVASSGDAAPPLPDDAGQGTGKRVVYDRASQRVWAVDDDERIVRSYLVSGSRYRNELPGVHYVYSRSEEALGWDLGADLPYMIRYLQTERGHIGFHAIPSWRDTGEALQTVDELGQKLSGGCQRQAIEDALFLWEFAPEGTKVIVL